MSGEFKKDIMVFVYSFIKKLDVVFGDVLIDYKVRLQTLPPIRSELGKYMHIASCLSIPCLFLPNRTPNVFEYLCFSHRSWRTVPYPSIRRTSCFSLCSLREYLVALFASAKDVGSIPGSGRFLGRGNSNPFQYYCLEIPMDRWAWQATVHGVTKSWTWFSD